MRVFWAVIAVLVIATIVFAWAGGSDGDSDSTASPPPRLPPPVAPPVILVEPSVPAPTPPGAVAAPPAASTSDPAAELAADLLASSERAADADDATPNAGAAPDDAAPFPDDAAEAPAGAFLIDGKHQVAGSGTAADPFQIDWDLLVSASETYQPRLGKTELPAWVEKLDGKHIKIAGYLTFPLAQMETQEVLVMLNMWDGCCIGMPPSPFDAIEVKLREIIALGNTRVLNYGTLTGVFRVDPYLQNEWLLGLYLVEDGKLDFGM